MEQLFRAENIRKYYPRSNFNLEVDRIELNTGNITGVVGENGNGKTTLLNIIAGELVSEGKFQYFGESVHAGKDWSGIKDRIAFIPQRIPRWYGTLIQNLQLKAAMENIPADEIDDYLNEILEFLGLMEYKHLNWTEISTGYRLRFELARVLIGRPNLLVLDEPLANLDINTQQKFLSDLKNLLKDKDFPTAVVLSSQQLHEIETVANHMIFLKSGKSIFSGATDSLQKEDEGFVFELQVEDDEKLETYLDSQHIDYTKRGEYYHVKSATTFSSFLKDVILNDIEIKYSRDISKSTKRLFEQ